MTPKCRNCDHVLSSIAQQTEQGRQLDVEHQACAAVRPFYAVKCNGDPALLSVLAATGAGFDCASEAEIASVMALGVAPDRIIFANACKRPSDIK